MTDPNCLFCRIAAGTIPATIVHRDERMVAFKDISPQAPVHLVLVPLEHFAGLNDLDPERAGLLGHLALVARDLAKAHGVDRSGWRLLANCGPDAGQTVFHLHLHLLGGAPMSGRLV